MNLNTFQAKLLGLAELRYANFIDKDSEDNHDFSNFNPGEKDYVFSDRSGVSPMWQMQDETPPARTTVVYDPATGTTTVADTETGEIISRS